VDRENRRISLGYKQLEQDPWPQLSRNYAVGNETTGKILRLLDRGVIVDLGEQVEGFVPTMQLGKAEISKPADAFNEGDELPLKVIEFDHPGKKIVLSVEAYYRGREKTELEAFLAKHPTKTQKVEEIVEEKPQLAPGEEKKEEPQEPKEEVKETAPTPQEIPAKETPESQEEKPTSEEIKEAKPPEEKPSESPATAETEEEKKKLEDAPIKEEIPSPSAEETEEGSEKEDSTTTDEEERKE
jgi:small subunit ribosomal protein S1